MERLSGYHCPRCSYELTAVTTEKSVGVHKLGKKLSLDCDNCGFVWFGVPDTSPVKQQKAKVKSSD